MRTRRQQHVNVELLEGKALLSTLPILSLSTFNQVVRQIDRAAGTLAKTHNENNFVATLSHVSTEVPFGHSQLFPTWQADVSIYDPTVPGSGMTMVKQLTADLKDYVQSSADDGTIALRGKWGSGFAIGTGAAPDPVLSSSTYHKALRGIDRAAGTFAKTHNEAAFLATLSQISTTIPYGHDQLLPTWQADVSIYDPTVPGSGAAMVKQLDADLASYVQTSVADRSFGLR